MHSIDTILSSKLGRKAVETTLVNRTGRPAAANFLRELLEEIEKLAESCQLTEFTEHGLPHLGSLVNRIDTWTRQGSRPLLDALTTDDAFLLLFAVVSHDIGMMSQREGDLSEEDRLRFARAYADLPGWVRRTHVPRLEGILRRLLTAKYPEFVGSVLFQLGCALARSHNFWPNQTGYLTLDELAIMAQLDPARMKGLAGVLAVCDLLDEDSGRCDSMTLFANKAGDLRNRAHWLRHLLTANRLCVVNGEVSAQICVPRNLTGKIDAALGGLRNHLRLAQVYNPVLHTLGAAITVDFPPPQDGDEVPEEQPLELLLCDPEIHLLRTFDPDALPAADANHPTGSMVSVMGVGLERIDLGIFDQAHQGGRLDLEITYAAAAARGESQRLIAVRMLRDAVLEANARGDITAVQTFSRLVLKNVGGDDKHFLPQEFWAPVFAIHWARNKGDLLSIEWALLPPSHGQSDAAVLQQLPMKWRVPALTVGLLLLRRPGEWSMILDLLRARADLPEEPLSYEERISWHDLVEALWATGHLTQDVPIEFWRLFGDLQEIERKHSASQRVLAELAWRMAVQSHCLTGFGRWETLARPQSRTDYALPPDPSREALSAFWLSWFHQPGEEPSKAATKARQANPPGYELHVAATEALWLVNHHNNSGEYTHATEQDSVSKLVDRAVTALLDTSMAPKKEGTYYLGGRGPSALRAEALLGERSALRRWMVGSWHKVIGANVQAILTVAHVMQLEGDRELEPVLNGVIDLPWGKPFGGKSAELLEELLPKLEPLLTVEHLKPIWEAISRSPRRIGNVRHPGLRMLTDAMTSDMLPLLIEWTDLELTQPIDDLWPDAFGVWADLLPYIDMPHERWARLSRVIDHSLRFMHRGKASSRIVLTVLKRSPWPVAARVVSHIAEALMRTDTQHDWADEAKAVVVNGLVQRTSSDWKGTPEHKSLMVILEQMYAASGRPTDKTLVDFLGEGSHPDGYEGIAEQWLQHLEQIRDRIVNEPGNYSIGGLGNYPVGPSQPISDEMAERAAQVLREIWNATEVTDEEVGSAARTAGHLIRASNGAGRVALAQAILMTMATKRPAVTIGVDQEDASYYAWSGSANHSAHLPDEVLTDLATVLVERLLDLPLRVAWAQARYAMELVVRGDMSLRQRAGYPALLALRARTLDHRRWAAEAFVASTKRLLEADEWPGEMDQVLSILVDWAALGASVPNPVVRESVARHCLQLSVRIPASWTPRLEKVLDRLRRDVRLRVRNAAGAPNG